MELQRRKVPTEKKPEPTVGMIQWMLGPADQPNQKRQTGMQNPPITCWREPFFGFEFAILVELRFDYYIEVVEEWRDNNHCAEQDSHERQTFFAQLELVNALEDDWK